MNNAYFGSFFPARFWLERYWFLLTLVPVSQHRIYHDFVLTVNKVKEITVD